MNKENNNKPLFSLQGCIVIFVLLISPLILLIISEWGSKSRSIRIKARSQASAISMAIKQYETTYGTLPYGEEKTEQDTVIDDEYEALIELLSCVDGPDLENTVLKNSRGTRFLEVHRLYPEKGHVDPWGNRFKIFIDTNYDKKLSIGGKKISANVLVYSLGKNKADDQGEDDDICSWK